MKKNLFILMALFLTIATVSAQEVIYNNKTGIFHDLDCQLAKQCTKNCTSIDILEAIEKDAKPCEKCRTDYENYRDVRYYRERKKEEQKRKEMFETPGVKKHGNYTFEIREKK